MVEIFTTGLSGKDMLVRANGRRLATRRAGFDDNVQPEPGALARIPGFSDVPESDLSSLEEKGTTARVPRGTVLMEAGDTSDKLFLVLSGRFLVMREASEDVIAEIGPGEPLGELAFFAGVCRTARVIAARDSTVFVLTREAYSDVISKAPGIVSAILASVSERLARVTSEARAINPSPTRAIALVPTGTRPELPEVFVERLVSAALPGKAGIVTRETFFDSHHPATDDEIAADLRDYIDAAEDSADIVFFALDRKEDAFTQACLNRADEILLIAPAAEAASWSAVPTRFEVEATRLFLKVHRSLALWRETAATPIAGTEAWLNQRDVTLHHHVALDSDADFERLGRFLTGAALGLVLGGGAALGCGHLGVAKALQEARVPIDFIGGTSVGAALGAALATGMAPDEILERTEEMFVKQRAMHRMTIPVYSLLDHRRMDRALHQNYGGFNIEDLPINFFAVSTSLTKNDMHLHRRGSAWVAVRASASIPGVLPPFITEDGDVLVDGALIDNVPLDAMRSLKPGPNIVVTFKRASEWRVNSDYSRFPARHSVLLHLLFPSWRRHPTIGTTLLHAMNMASERRKESLSDYGDLVVVPEGTEGVGLRDWHKSRYIADSAYQHMTRMLNEGGGVEGLLASAAERAVN